MPDIKHNDWVQLEGEGLKDAWRPRIVTEQARLKGLFKVGDHFYYADGRPIADDHGAPRIVETVDFFGQAKNY